MAASLNRQFHYSCDFAEFGAAVTAPWCYCDLWMILVASMTDMLLLLCQQLPLDIFVWFI